MPGRGWWHHALAERQEPSSHGECEERCVREFDFFTCAPCGRTARGGEAVEAADEEAVAAHAASPQPQARVLQPGPLPV